MWTREVQYDIRKLKPLREIDLDRALKNFNKEEDFFVELTSFTQDAFAFLKTCDPRKVISSNKSRDEFLAELERLRHKMTSIGVKFDISEINGIENAVLERDKIRVTSLVSEFVLKLESVSRLIASTQIQPPTDVYDAMFTSEKKTILALDDKPELLSTVISILNGIYTVMAVTSGAAALKVTEKYLPDLFLLDIQMPQMNGYQFASIIRKDPRFKSTPIIFLTSKGERNDIIEAVKHGGNDYIIKPVDKEILMNKLRLYLG